MTRLLAVVLIAAGLTLVGAPAHAEVTITIRAGRTALPVGESTAIRGKAVGAEPGSVVKLQRRVSGSWRTVAKKKVWSTRRYSFRVSPPRGYQRFRVKKAWHRGQPPAVSPTLRLAVLQVSIRAERTTLMHGDSTHIKGKAFGADRGSVVKLQQRLGGTWRTMRKERLRSTRRYSFSLTPPRGYQRYRVVKPWHDRQPRIVSAVRKVTVQWRPEVLLGDVDHQVDSDDGAVTTNVSGTTSGVPAGSDLWRQQRQNDGTWTSGTSVGVATDGTWSDSFASRHGEVWRYWAPASGARLAAGSSEFRVNGTWISASAALDSLTDTTTVVGTSTLHYGATVRRQFRDGDTWRMDSNPIWVEADGSFSDSFPADVDRTYRYAGSGYLDDPYAWSEPFHIPDAEPALISLDSTTEVTFPANGTTRTLLVDLEEHDTFTFYNGSGDAYNGRGTVHSVTDPNGAELTDLGNDAAHFTTTASVAGTYTIALERSKLAGATTTSVTLSTPVQRSTSLDAPGQDLENQLPGQVVDVSFEADGGQVISEFAFANTQTTFGAATVLDPTGDEVPRWDYKRGIGVYSLPEITGTYTLRITPTRAQVQRDRQIVLRAREGSIAVNGAPGPVSFDQPGRVGVLSMAVDAGLDLMLSTSDAGFWDYEPTLFGPDGERVRMNSPRVNPTSEGEYTLLVAGRDPTAVDFYATTPAAYDLTVGSSVEYDQWPTAQRRAELRIPVTAGQLFSVGVFDDAGELCNAFNDVQVAEGHDLVEWTVDTGPQPAVFKIAETGELVLRAGTCTMTGTFRSLPATISSSTVTGTRELDTGGAETTMRAIFEAAEPGQVMIAEYDGTPGHRWPGRVDIRAVESTLPAGTALAFVEGAAGSSDWPDNFEWGDAETFTTTFTAKYGKRYMYLWAGPTATGSLEMELKRVDY